MMAATAFPSLPDEARVWVFASPVPLSAGAATEVLRRVDDFLSEWHAHGHAVAGSRELLHDRFLLIAADEEATGVSGCSIDSLFRVLKQVEMELGISMLDSSLVFYRDASGLVEAVDRAEFRKRVGGGDVTENTLVFDNTIRTIRDIRNGGWEKPMAESWHGRAFAVASAS
jgi:hypothetical protein